MRAWQLYLLGLGDYQGEVHGRFDAKTEQAVRAFQRRHYLQRDGVVGDQTWGAGLTRGLKLCEAPPTKPDRESAHWPGPRDGLRPLNQAGRERLFGHINFVPAPTKRNPEGIRITNDWKRNWLTYVTIPQLKGVGGAPKSGRVFVNLKAADPLKDLFVLWEENGLLDRVLTWGGSWCARFVRGSRRYLSNHAYGTAFDINAAWNPLGRHPALYGKEGCVRELVETANSLGWFWGGHYAKRPDGMHFELVVPDIYL